MNRCELAHEYHKKGFNCCQSVVAAFHDLTGLTEQESFNVASGFGSGAGTGELCGALVGGIMALNLLHPTDPADPIGSKKRSVALAKELQARFKERFGYVRCQDLLANKEENTDKIKAATAMGLTVHCQIMVVTAVEVVEEMLAEQECGQ